MLLKTIITSALAFAATNIDDLFILTLFYGSRKIKSYHILIGQSLGIGALVAVSLPGAFVADFIDQRYVGLLGFIPIYLATKQLMSLHTKQTDTPTAPQTMSVLGIAGITIANGGDNIGVYVPLLSLMETAEKVLLVVTFAAMVWVWCLVAQKIASQPLIAKHLEKSGHRLMPLVLFLLGAYILYESNTHTLLFK